MARRLPRGNRPGRLQEHQANERTYLAWLRTSIALVSLGFAIARFGLFLRELQYSLTRQFPSGHPWLNSENLGIALTAAGIALILVATWRYNQVYWQIERSQYRPNRWVIWSLTAVVVLLGLASIPLTLRQHPMPAPAGRPPQAFHGTPMAALGALR